MLAHLFAVDPQFRVAIDAVKEQDGAATLRHSRSVEALAIPSDAADYPSGSPFAFAVHPAEGTDGFGTVAVFPNGSAAVRRGVGREIFDGPVVRQIDLAPR